MNTKATAVIELPIADIVVPEAGRRELGNVLILAGSIERVGLLHPLVLNTRNELIAGRRRLAAVKRLGWEAVPVRVVESLDDALRALQAEQDENTCREPLTVLEALELCKRLEEIEKPKAAERKTAGINQHTEPSGKLPEGSRGQTRDKVGAAVGMSGKTYDKAKKITTAAQKEPEKFGDLPAVMEEKSVDAAFKELKRREAPAPTPELATALTAPTRTVAVSQADDAINVLRSIPRDDPQRVRGLKMVAEWISLNGSPVVCGKAPDTKAAADDGKAIRMGHQAINALMQIRPGDPRRARAYQIVSDWMSQNPVATEATKQAEPPVASPNGSYLRDLLATYNEEMPPEHRYGLEEIAKFSGLALDRVKQLDQGEDPTFAERIMLLEAVELNAHDDLTADEFEALQRGRQSRADRKKRLMRERRRVTGNAPSVAQDK